MRIRIIVWCKELTVLAFPAYALFSVLILAPLGFDDIEVHEVEEWMIPHNR